jgi:four helix bundle protein
MGKLAALESSFGANACGEYIRYEMHEFDSKVFKDSLILAKVVRRIVKRMDKTDQFTIGQQMIRSSVSIPSNVSEGFGRNSTPQIITFLNYAHGSCCELISQLMIIEGTDTLSNDESTEYIGNAINIKHQLFKLLGHYTNK